MGVHKTTAEALRKVTRTTKKSLEWLKSYDLASSDGVRGFLQEIIHRTWTGELGSRQAGALNGTMRLLLEHDLLPELEKRIKSLEDNKGMKTN